MNKIELGTRWWELPSVVKKHPVISKFLADSNRNIITCAGRRSYKSEINKRKIALYAMTRPNTSYLIICPTIAQTVNVYWNGVLNIFDLIPPGYIKRCSDSKYRIELMNGSIIQLASADTIERSEGVDYDGCVIDEAGDVMDLKNVIEMNIQPMLMNAKGFLYISGVPRQTYPYYKELYEKYSDSRAYPDWSCYTWKSADVLDAAEIEKIKANIDPLTFLQEYEGTFHTGYKGLCYYPYSDSKHIRSLTFNRSLPLHIACDFNTSIMPWTLFQIQPNEDITCFDQVVDRHTYIPKMADNLKEKLCQLFGSEQAAKSHALIFNGDYTGTNQSATAKGSIWEVLLSLFVNNGWNAIKEIKTNPEVERRVNATNARLMSADNKIHLYVDEKCQELIKDFKNVNWQDLNRNKEMLERQERTHSSDALSYAVNKYFPTKNLVQGG